jgi:hypothetical protein
MTEQKATNVHWHDGEITRAAIASMATTSALALTRILGFPLRIALKISGVLVRLQNYL